MYPIKLLIIVMRGNELWKWIFKLYFQKIENGETLQANDDGENEVTEVIEDVEAKTAISDVSVVSISDEENA